jgi:hypothetical protein
MKAVFFSLATLLFVASASLSQTTYTSGEWNYILVEGGTATLVGYNGQGPFGQLDIPRTVDGYAVTRLGNTNRLVSFLGAARAATNITIPYGVEIISASAFSSCTNLTSIEIPGSVKFVGFRAFNGCTAITNVVLRPGVGVIAPGAFMSADKLTRVVVPNTVLDIGQAAFDTDVELIPDNSALALDENFIRALTNNDQFIDALAARISSVPGPQGPQGPQGPRGPQGSPGGRFWPFR